MNRWLCAAFAVLLAVASSVAMAAPAAQSQGPAAAEVLRREVARLLIVGLDGDDSGSAAARSFVERLAGLPLGGIIIMDRNVASEAALARFIVSVQSALPEVQLVAVDQEGGAVRRLRRLPSVPATPSAKDVAATSPAAAFQQYSRMAASLARLGVNLNLGPVVDLDAGAASPVIGRLGRSYGHDPETVARYASAFIRAHRLFGVETAIKHFPGHGSPMADPHQVAVSAPRWSPEELTPFAAVIAEDRPGVVMTSHVAVGAAVFGLDHAEVTTFSPRIVAYLRDVLGFGGLVISDDLTMGAIRAEWTPEAAVGQAILAGHDMVILANLGDDPERRIEAIITQVADRAARDPALAAAVGRASGDVERFKLAEFGPAASGEAPAGWTAALAGIEAGLRTQPR